MDPVVKNKDYMNVRMGVFIVMKAAAYSGERDAVVVIGRINMVVEAINTVLSPSKSPVLWLLASEFV
jgi:hypothetical protein